MKRALFIFVAVSVYSIVGTAHADMLQVNFSGNIFLAYDDGPALVTTSISNASTFIGKFIYNTNRAPSSVSPYSASYDIEPGFNITIDGTYFFGVNNPGAVITNDEPTSPSGYLDEIVAGGSWLDGIVMPFSISPSDLSNVVVGIFLEDWTGTALSNTSLPNTINLGAFGDKLINIYIDYYSSDGQFAYDLEIQGTITSLDVEPIPEPTTLLLFGTGLAGVAGAARRRKKNQV